MEFFIVGAGIWGCVLAERIANVLNLPVTVIEKRNHIGGNSWSYPDAETGIECHAYGSHIFHTRLGHVWEYIRQFTEFNSYRHKVLTIHKGRVYAMPINLFTINKLYGAELTPSEAEDLLKRETSAFLNKSFSNLETKALSQIGPVLYEAFIAGYTRKQWHKEPRFLDASVISRLPVRLGYNMDYFDDPWQGIPMNGFGRMFENMLKHPRIKVWTNCDFNEVRDNLPSGTRIIYTGMADELFKYKYGPLEWRSLRFEQDTIPVRDYQGTAVMNYADAEIPYTRIHEFKHYHPERGDWNRMPKTVICHEYPEDYGPGKLPCYPVNNPENDAIHRKYAEAAKAEGIILGGRLGSYRYWDMDKAIDNALEVFKTQILPLSRTSSLGGIH